MGGVSNILSTLSRRVGLARANVMCNVTVIIRPSVWTVNTETLLIHQTDLVTSYEEVEKNPEESRKRRISTIIMLFFGRFRRHKHVRPLRSGPSLTLPVCSQQQRELSCSPVSTSQIKRNTRDTLKPTFNSTYTFKTDTYVVNVVIPPTAALSVYVVPSSAWCNTVTVEPAHYSADFRAVRNLYTIVGTHTRIGLQNTSRRRLQPVATIFIVQ